jgi:hypothetical protein
VSICFQNALLALARRVRKWDADYTKFDPPVLHLISLKASFSFLEQLLLPCGPPFPSPETAIYLLYHANSLSFHQIEPVALPDEYPPERRPKKNQTVKDIRCATGMQFGQI